MLNEISAAVRFLTRLVSKHGNLDATQIEGFGMRVSALLVERFRDHWFPDKPFKGQGYRCIRVNEMDHRDPVLERAALECGLSYDDLRLPVELTIWVDPDEVCCRFGEHKGSYCTVASFNVADKENYNTKIHFGHLENAMLHKTKQVSLSPKRTANLKSRHASTKHQQYIHNLVPGSSPSNFYCVPHMPHVVRHHGNSSTPRAQHRHGFRNALTASPSVIESQEQPYAANRNDRFHWVNKSVN